MKIGILGAMPEEVRNICTDLRDGASTTIGNRLYQVGLFHGVECVTVFSRWGKVASASTVTTLIDRFGVDVVIFTGVAGAARPDLEIGDIVIADRLLQHDVDASASGLFTRFEIPLLGVSSIPVEAKYVAAAADAANTFINNHLHTEKEALAKAELARIPKVYIGTVASGDQFIASVAQLALLRETIPNLLCVEMEGAAVAQICYEFGVPCVVIRSISDKADHSAALDFPKFVEHVASIYSSGIVRGLVENIRDDF